MAKTETPTVVEIVLEWRKELDKLLRTYRATYDKANSDTKQHSRCVFIKEEMPKLTARIADIDLALKKEGE